MAFPPSAYTTCGGVAPVSRAAEVEGLFTPTADAVGSSNLECEAQPDSKAASTPEPVADAA